MSWVRLDDRLPYHRKVRSIPPKLVKPCYAIYVASIQFCQWAKNDGRIRKEDLGLLLPTAPKPSRKEIDALVGAGLWEEMVGGWEIHDYLEHNASAVERSAKARDASNARWNAHRNAPSNAQRNADSNPLLSSPLRSSPLHSPPLLSGESPDGLSASRDGRGPDGRIRPAPEPPSVETVKAIIAEVAQRRGIQYPEGTKTP